VTEETNEVQETNEVEKVETKRYKVLRGTFCHGKVRYKRGSIVESAADLLKYNCGPMSQKFELVGATAEEVIAKPNATEFTDYTVEELKLIADDEEVDIKGLTKKADIIEALQRAMLTAE
jgi:hypothetical protein